MDIFINNKSFLKNPPPCWTEYVSIHYSPLNFSYISNSFSLLPTSNPQ